MCKRCDKKMYGITERPFMWTDIFLYIGFATSLIVAAVVMSRVSEWLVVNW